MLKWFRINSLKANPGKFQFMVLGADKVSSYNLFIDVVKVFCSKEVKLLRIATDKQLKFKNLSNNAYYKFHALRKLRLYLTVHKARLPANLFVDSHFNYALLIWMFGGKTTINKICKIHYKTLQVVYNNFTNSFDALLSIDIDISIHQKHLRYLNLRVYKMW